MKLTRKQMIKEILEIDSTRLTTEDYTLAELSEMNNSELVFIYRLVYGCLIGDHEVITVSN